MTPGKPQALIHVEEYTFHFLKVSYKKIPKAVKKVDWFPKFFFQEKFHKDFYLDYNMMCGVINVGVLTVLMQLICVKPKLGDYFP